MSEKLLELSSVVNVLSRTVGDLEKQRQNNETRAQAIVALLQAVVQSMSPDQRATVARNFEAAAAALVDASTATGRTALRRELAELRSRLG